MNCLINEASVLQIIWNTRIYIIAMLALCHIAYINKYSAETIYNLVM